jgi:hypothetical protein
MEYPANPRRTALGIALFADALQIVFLPLFGEGVLSPVNDLLDIAVAWVLTRLLGWHWVFVPSFLAELVPGLDLVPTWTLAVLMVTRHMTAGSPETMAPSRPGPPIIEGRL